MPLNKSVLTEQTNITFKNVLRDVRSDVESGLTFADSLRKHPKVFDDLFVNLVAARTLSH